MRKRKEIDGYNYRFILCDECEGGFGSCIEQYERIEERAKNKEWIVLDGEHLCPDCK